MKSVCRILVLVFVLATMAVVGDARANLVLNGNFASYMTGSNGPGEVGSYSTVASWSSANQVSGQAGANFLYTPGLADTTGSYYPVNSTSGVDFKLWGPNDGSNNGLTAASPTGSNFIGMDGDSQYSGALSQNITGLVAGHFYQLTFNWAGAEQQGYSSATSDFFSVNLGTVSASNPTQTTATIQNAAEGFTGWKTATMTFTATGSSELLSFLANASPSGVPPFLLLSDVSLNAVVPEPASLVLMGVGLIGMVGYARGRKARLKLA